MIEKYKPRLDLFAANVQGIKKNFVWQNVLLKRLAALLYAAAGKEIDCAALRESYDLIKKNTGLFSAFRGNSAMSVATLLSLSDNREEKIGDTLSIYGMLKKAKFYASDYLVIAAYQIAAHSSPDQYRKAVERAAAFYTGMKEKHWFLIGQDDYIFAAMLGLSDVDVPLGLARLEELYAELKPHHFPGNGLQALTQVLVLGNKTADGGTRLLALRDAFRSRRFRMDREYTLSALGVLTLLPVGGETIVDDVISAYEYLRMQKGFGSWTVSKQELLLLSAAIVALGCVDDVQNGLLTATVATSITNIIIAQQTAIAVAAGSSAAAGAASSGS